MHIRIPKLTIFLTFCKIKHYHNNIDFNETIFILDGEKYNINPNFLFQIGYLDDIINVSASKMEVI